MSCCLTTEEDPVTTMPSRQSVLDRIEADYPEGNEFRDTSIGTVWTDDALGALIDGIILYVLHLTNE